MRWTVLFVLATAALPCAVHAETREVVAGPQYEAGGWFRFLFGEGYRDLWTTPIEVEVLDLEKDAGGLTPVRQVGQAQTLGLALKGADGKAYTFRSLHKHPERMLPEFLRDQFPAKIVQDATSGTHPAAALILPPLAEAAGIPTNHPRFVSIPDDPALGEFREKFAGEFGTLEEFPLPAGDGNPGFMGATEIVSTGELWKRWMESPANRIDSQAFLRARVLDLWVDNFDRHSGNWRWMALPGRDKLTPLPEDPDMVLVYHDGQVMKSVRNRIPRLLKFTGEYSGRLDGPLMNCWAVDRWLFADLERADFEKMARELQGTWTDEVIETALRQMPPEWYALDGPDKVAKLKKRRSDLVDYVLRVYRYYADQVDVHGTNEADHVTIRRLDDDAVEVTLAPAGDPTSPYYRRRFVPDETKEVRIYLHGGSDHVERTGPAGGPIAIQAIVEGGRNVVDDSRSGGTQVWRDGGTVDVERGSGTKVHGPWVDPHADSERPWVQSRSWGHWTVPQTIVGWKPDLDLLLGAGFTRTSWGFRDLPYHSKQSFAITMATGDPWPGKAEYVGDFRRTASRVSYRVHGLASGLERINFFGLGNDTPQETDPVVYKSEETVALFNPTIRYELGRRLDAFVGAAVRYTDSGDDPDTILGQTMPYGIGGFGAVGVTGGFELDTREPVQRRATGGSSGEVGINLEAEQTVNGLAMRVGGAWVPEAWDVLKDYSWVDGEVDAYLGDSRAHLAVRVGGRHTWGDYPWFDAAFIGGGNARAYRSDRFAGDSSLYGSAEVRLWLGNVNTGIVPVRLGVFGLVEAGRVWLEGEDSNTWHPSYGGGLLFQPVGVATAFNITAATGDEGTRFYFGAGFGF